jgi:formamidopyrimidine-DNA glycosylase
MAQRGLERDLNGHRFDAPHRHGKWLILPTDGPALLVHSAMTGHPYYALPGAPGEGWERLVVSLGRGELRYADQRNLRGVWLAAREDGVAQVMGRQGPDALGMDVRTFRERLSGRHGRLKATLMDQSVIAGLGNLLTDEICSQARLHPSRSISDLDETISGNCSSPVCAMIPIRVARAAAPGSSTVGPAAGRRYGTHAASRGQASWQRHGPHVKLAVMSSVMNSTKRRWMTIAAVTATAICSQLIPATAQAQNERHNVTYIARVDGVAPGSQATFRISDAQVNTANLSSVPGTPFEANTVLADPAKAGMQVAIHWPYSANVHCEIDVDDNVAAQVDKFVSPQPGNTDPMNGVLPCGAPLTTT